MNEINEPKKPRKPGSGRRKFFTPERIQKVFQLAQRGLNDTEICEAMGVSRYTFYKEMKINPEFRTTIDEGREKSIDNVENALFKNAVGYDFEEITQHIKQAGETEVKEIKKTKKHIKGDTIAQIFILKNRRPDKWKDRTVTEHDGKIDVHNHTATEINFTEITGEDIEIKPN